MKVRDILHVKGTTLYTAQPDLPLTQIIKHMADDDVGSLVIMEQGQLVGLITFREVIRALANRPDAMDHAVTRTFMQTNPPIANMETPLDELRRLMLDRHARYMPIMEQSMLMGVVSFYDVERAVVAKQDLENRLLKAYIKDWPDSSSS